MCLCPCLPNANKLPENAALELRPPDAPMYLGFLRPLPLHSLRLLPTGMTCCRGISASPTVWKRYSNARGMAYYERCNQVTHRTEKLKARPAGDPSRSEVSAAGGPKASAQCSSSVEKRQPLLRSHVASTNVTAACGGCMCTEGL